MGRPDREDLAAPAILHSILTLVADGRAVLSPLDGGRLELRLRTGEVFVLTADAVTRRR